MTPPDLSEAPGALRFVLLYGSHAHGTAGPTSDEDWRGVFEPMHRGFAVRYPYPSGVSATLRSGSLRGGLPMVLVCGLVCA